MSANASNAVQEWDELKGHWDDLKRDVDEAAAGNGDLASVRAAAAPSRDLARHIWLRSSPTIESLISGGTTLTFGGEVSLAAGVVQMVDSQINAAMSLAQVQAAIPKVYDLIRIGRIYAVPPKGKP